ncbi:MAG: ATP-binding protein [Gammaproteobacteria bacterium]|nr:ATP-binding protein [Gammaproteobacteria bacterium]MCP5197752.1 ATP-binding protein [Gammaproteobacteria bacterium]
MPKMRTSFQGLVRLLANSLYPEPEVFIRELLQNAHDSIQLRRIHTPEPAGEIRIDVDEAARTLSFVDNGSGMDQRDIEDFLSVIGSTGTGSRAHELATRDVAVTTIGQFGIGLLSTFVVAERVEILTRKPGATSTWRWVNHGGEDYQLEALPAVESSFGTRVMVTLAPDRTVFLDGRLLRQTVRRYADFLPFPILLNGCGPLNAVNAPWHESSWNDPVEQKRSLAAFLSQRYADPALLVIPVDLAQPRVWGGLFIPARYMPGRSAGGAIDLFQARMAIRPNDAELLPEWAQFVRGVVDCSDLQPTAARDNVLRDAAWHALRAALGARIIAALLDLATSDQPRFLQLCDWHHDAIKGMAARHGEFGAAVLDQLPFATHQGQLTLPDMLSRQPVLDNGQRPLYFFTHETDANQFYTLCQARGVLAIDAGRPFDETLLRRYADQHTRTVALKPLDRLDDPDWYEPLAVAEQTAYRRLERAVDWVLAKRDVSVQTEVRRFQPASLSAVLLAGQRMAAFDAMEQALERPFVLDGLAELAGEVRDRLRQQPLCLFLNAEHALVQRLGALVEPEHPHYRSVLTGLYYSALLNAQHRLTPAVARRFHADLQGLLLEHLDLWLRQEPSGH